MNQRSRIFDDIGRLMNDAVGVADGFRREVETVVRAQVERFIGDMDLVKREDFDALRELVQTQSEEIAALRTELAGKPGKKKAAE
jgi:BMFP domain-containing protein YqiC